MHHSVRGDLQNLSETSELQKTVVVEQVSGSITTDVETSTKDLPEGIISVTAHHLSKARRILLVASLACAGFLNIASVQSTVIVLPSISRDLNIPASRQQWVASAYNLAFGCILLLWGRLADIYGRRLVFLSGSAFITIVNIAIPFSPTEVVFDILRAFQGLGGAATVPSAVGILGSTFPPGKQRNYAFIAYSAGSSLGSVIGNICGGLVGTFLTWKWIFWMIAIIAAAITFAGYFLIPAKPSISSEKREKKPQVDWFGAGIITGSLVLLLFALSEGNVVGWGTPWIPLLIVLSVILAIGFFFWQRFLERGTGRSPLMKVSMFKNLQFSAAFLVIMTFFAAYNSYLVFATYYFQDYQGLDTLQTTLRFLPSGIAGLMIAFVTAQLISITPGFYLLLFAASCGIISPLLFAIPIPPTTTYWAFGFPAMCLCFSADIISPTMNLFVVQQLPQDNQSLGGAMIQVANQLGRSLGLAIATAVETAITGTDTTTPGSVRLLKGLRAAEWVNVSLAVLAFVIILSFLRSLLQVGVRKTVK